jgi:hypothetical protein
MATKRFPHAGGADYMICVTAGKAVDIILKARSLKKGRLQPYFPNF